MKISVLTPSYNSAKYIKRAISSVLIQDWSDWEHIVVDGKSGDGTVDILKEYTHLKWISEPDRGQSDAMNKAFSMASGEVILYLNADDEMAPGLLRKINNVFESKIDKNMIVGDLKVERIGKTYIERPSINLFNILDLNRYRFPLNSISYAYRKGVQLSVGPFPVENHFSMDYWFLLRAYLLSEVVKIDFVCGTFYFVVTNKSADANRSSRELRQVRDQFINENLVNPLVIFFIVYDFLRIGKFLLMVKKAKKTIWKRISRKICK